MISRILKWLMFLVGGILILLLVVVCVLWIKSPGTAQPLRDSSGEVIQGSISTIEKVTIGGVEQHVIIRGANADNPVMLFIHGGPGSPELAFIKDLNPEIENDFIMIHWEQRGAGKSYSKDIPPETMTLEQFIADTHEITEYLIERFDRKKIFIMGHSWGSLLGILTAHQYPDLYYAYFGIGQVAKQLEGEKISLEWVKEQARERNDEDAIKALSELRFPDLDSSDSTWLDYLLKQRMYVAKFGGSMRNITGMWPMIKMLINTKEYTLTEKLNYMKGSLFSLNHLWREVVNADLLPRIDSMQVPVYIFQGVHDYQTPYSIAKDFYDRLKAPEKELFTFENSAHAPIVEEADKFNSIVREKARLVESR